MIYFVIKGKKGYFSSYGHEDYGNRKLFEKLSRHAIFYKTEHEARKDIEYYKWLKDAEIVKVKIEEIS